MAPLAPAGLVVLLSVLLALTGCLLDSMPDPAGPTETIDPSPPASGDEQPGSEPEPAQAGNQSNRARGNSSTGKPPGNGTNNGDLVDPGWPALSQATIRPGVPVLNNAETVPPPALTAPHLCTSNFLFHSPGNRTLYLGTASHCVVFGLSPGDRVPIHATDGSVIDGTLVYCSFGAIQGSDTCPDEATLDAGDAWNDLALIEIDAEDRHLAHPAVLHWGGPTGVAAPDELVQGEPAMTYGSTRYREAARALDAREGYVWSGDARVTRIQFEVPSIQGDSGSPVISGDGLAIGVVRYLGEVSAEPMPVTVNGISNLAPMLESASEHGLDIEVSTWPRLAAGDLPVWPLDVVS